MEKQKKREHARRVDRQRRLDADRCAALMFEAEMAWENGNLEGCGILLEKVLRVRSNHAGALEWGTELCFDCDRPEQALAYYERLRHQPDWPPTTFFAAASAWQLGRVGQCQQLLSRFLSESSRRKDFPIEWRAARLLEREVQRAKKSSRPPAGTDQRQGHFFTAPQTHAVVNSAASESPEQARGNAVSEEISQGCDPDLPALPKISVPGIDLRFEFEKIGLDQAPVMPLAELFLRRDYALLKLQKGFDELLSLGGVKHVEQFWYQLETVRRVLRDFRGRALLADEVGLGKTIEACFVLKEYAMRGLVKKALILTPPSLVNQWLDELNSKFGLPAASPETGGYARGPELFWSSHDLIVASLALARQPANLERLKKIDYDLVIVDEAHYLKNRATSAWGLVNELKKRFLLLLSATPVGNNLTELYNLILLLRPGLLGTEAQFRRDYGMSGKASYPKPRVAALNSKAAPAGLEDPARRDRLRGLLREVMVRNTRAHIDLKLPRRLAATEMVRPDGIEAEVLEDLAGFIRRNYVSVTPAERLRLMMLQMQAGSSTSALRYGLREHADLADPLHCIAEKLSLVHQSAKARALIALARRSREKKVVFTRFLATLEELRTTLESEGFSVSVFHGSLSPAEKEAAVADFRDCSEILLSSESGGEGRNMQFCNTVINFDLPWNPVSIEQRVGRVHRIGQTREVYVFNFCLAGSVEEYVLQVLHDKINVFELVAGEIEMILGELDQEQDFSSIVMDLWARSETDGERENAFDRFAAELQRAKDGYRKTQEFDQAMFGEDYEA
jgi:superfamily II DNA or RNA helicase